MTMTQTPSNCAPSTVPPLVYIMVVNWNSWRDTIECLESLARLDYPNYRSLVIDNGSTDDSERRIRDAFPGVELVQTGANLGYAGGNNVGIRYALRQGAAYVLLVNPDVVLDPQSLAFLVATAESHTGVAALSPVIHCKDTPQAVWFGGGVIDWHEGTTAHKETVDRTDVAFLPSAWASGCCLLLRAQGLNDVGLFDPRYFLYYEENDLCQRFVNAGYQVGVCTTAVAYHQPSTIVGLQSPKHVYYMTRNSLHFFATYASSHGVFPLLPLSRIYRRAVVNLWGAVALFSRNPVKLAQIHGSLDFLTGRLGPSRQYR